ncbi:hypothetical protein QCA50_009961 [Cerrena zonata]|uniref:Phosphoglycerate mutase n=1 Tax=Cerrena zonata TaxID=2478898 RepID=A0AAW0G6W9_9APHY
MKWDLFILAFLFISQVIAISIPQTVFRIPEEIESKKHKKGKKVFTKYKSIDSYFKQLKESTDDSNFSIIDDFGLEDQHTWNDVIEEVQRLNNKHGHKKQYKLFFLARHGEAWHNVAEEYYSSKEWNCEWQMKDGNGTIEWFDAKLTSTGEGQIERLSKAWDSQIHHNNAPIPQLYYISPLTRTLQTFELTWSNLINIYDSKPKVVELARETYGIGTESKRHNASYIDFNFPFVKFDTGFTFNDDLWIPDKHESHQHRNYRAHLLLNEIFKKDDNTVISITSHSGLISSILKVIGHRKWELKTGQMVPVIIEGSKPGHYRKPTLDRPWNDLKECKDSSNEYVL